MRISDILSTAFLNLWRRKMRAFLTVLGMVIGVASIVVMVSLGIGIRQATVESFAGTGSLTTIRVSSWSYVSSGNGGGSSRQKELNKKAISEFKRISGVEAVMPLVETYGMIKSGNYATDASILGVTKEQAEQFGITLSQGTMPGSGGSTTYEIALGAWTLQNFYDPDTYRQAIDKNGNPKVTTDSRMQLTFDYRNIYRQALIAMDNDDSGEEQTPLGSFYKLRVTGIMDQDNNDFSYYCIMDATQLEKLAKANKDFTNFESGSYNTVLVKVSNIEDVKPVKTAITEMGYGTYSLQDAVEMAEESTKNVQYLLGAIGGVALLVAAIGIMNTMMMSIFERTKEIGIIKVLGCRMDNIAGLFLAESAYIGFFGGALGLGLSFGISVLLNQLLASSGLRSIIPAYLAFGAVGFSIIVALAAGMYPAIRAMKLSPLAAIRNE
ncbi:MAG: ABC transporter permease [Clostridiales bacterium]|nr:ABC transporter permease [Clostridiales bacterium]